MFMGGVLLVSSCATGGSAPIPVVDLSERVILSGENGTSDEPLRLAVAAILSPEGNIESYGALAEYLGSELDQPVEIVQRRTYEEINDLLESGDVDIGFICTSAYVRGHDDFGLRLLAAPQIDGESVYRSELIVPSGSSAETMEDLRGAVFAFTDPISTTGRVYPTHLVEQLGYTPDSFFRRYFFTYSHEAAIEAVAAQVADGAGVDSLVLEFVRARRPDLPVRVIDRSQAFTIPPVVASPMLAEEDASRIQALLLSLADDPKAKGVLTILGVDGFVAVDNASYDGIRELMDITATTP